MTKMRIAHLIGRVGVGGAERLVVNLLNALVDERPTLVLTDRREGNDLLSELDSRIEVLRVPCRRSRLPRDVVRLAKALRGRKIEVLHSHMFHASLNAALAARVGKIPVFVTSEHGRNPWKKPWHHWIERNVISRYADVRICVSEDIREVRRQSDRIPQDQLVVIPNGSQLGAPGSDELHAVPEVLAVGRLIEAKDYPTLLQAACLLRDQGRRFVLKIVGDGPLRESLARESAAAKLDSHVEWLGARRDVNVLMPACDVFVLCSVREGQPMVLLEAMSAARPIVATRVGGIPKTVNDGAEALLVPPGNPAALAQAIARLLDDRGLARRLGENARNRMREEFSIEAVAQAHLKLYSQLLAGARS
jgi:glycosyltransferase involved in cell wall biosynthesis